MCFRLIRLHDLLIVNICRRKQSISLIFFMEIINNENKTCAQACLTMLKLLKDLLEVFLVDMRCTGRLDVESESLIS